MGRFLAGVVSVCWLLAAGGPGVAAEAAEGLREDIPILLTADKVVYDRELGVITASGHVEVSQADRVLMADSITYNEKADVLTASGNVTLLEIDGEVLFARYMELSGDLKDGIIEDLGLIFTDGSRFAASGGRRSDARIIELRNAVYSPCRLCIVDPTRPPLWQIRAVKVIHDKNERTVEYTDAWLELWGVPIAYTPYLLHPDPTVNRRTGLLTPNIGTSSDLGVVVRVPYYVDIAPDKGLTLIPMLTTEEGPVLAAEYRQRLQDGELQLEASITNDSEDDVRGHIFSKGRFDLDETWRWGFDVNRTTDDTYLRRYGFGLGPALFGFDNTLTTRLFAEGFRERNYMSVNAFAFQGLRVDDDPGLAPLVIPLLDFNHVGEANRFGGRTSLDVNVLSLTRDEGTDTRRLSVNAGWQLNRVGRWGSAYTLSASLRGDLYHVNSVSRPGGQSDFSGVTGRFRPQVALDWRHPFVRDGGMVYQIVEPIASIIAEPFGGNPDEIPNEDSVDFVFDDTNLFSPNRFTGLDRVESGPRVNYGLRWGVFRHKGGSTNVLVGQSFRVRSDDTFAKGSGLEDHFSDIVGKVHISPGKYVDLLYRFRLSKDNLDPRRHEIGLSAGPPALSVNANYVFFDRQEDSEFTGREEITLALGSQLTRYWRSRVFGVRDLTAGEMRTLGLNLTFENECCTFSTTATRTFFEDRDLEPTDAIVFRVLFKTLGELQTGFTRSQTGVD